MDHTQHHHSSGMTKQMGHSHHDHHKMMMQDFKKRFTVCLIATIPLLFLSKMIQTWFGYSISFAGDKYLLAAMATFIFIYGGDPFMKGMAHEIKTKATGMMTLIGVAIIVAWSYSVAVTFGLAGKDFYWEMASLIVIMLIGHFFEMKSVMGASHSLEMLVKMMPSTAHRINNEVIEDIDITNVHIDDILLIKPGEKIPLDGKVIDGTSYVNESMLTGESKPVQKTNGSDVIGGAINGNGSLRIKVQKTGNDTYLKKVITMVDQAQKIKSKTQNFANRAAKILTYVALGGGCVTLGTWLFLGYPFVFALERMVTVMVICCPHALGLAVPLVVSISTTISAQKGILIRNRTAFEDARLITTVVFDKTGTLTKGSHELNQTIVYDNMFTEPELIRLASAVERDSEHFIGKAIINRAKESGIDIPLCTQFRNIPGEGVVGHVDSSEIKIVGPNYLKDHHINIEQPANSASKTVIYILVNEKVSGCFLFSDTLRESSQPAIAQLRSMGIKNLLLTGDNESVAKSVSDELKMDGFIANVLPHQKLEEVVKLQNKGEFVAMTGDGVNDAPALAQSDIGIAVGSGTDIAAETADIILVRSDPKDITKLIVFGKETYKKMLQNLWWAVGYNIVTIPLAAGVLYHRGFMLNPAVGAVLMSLSTIIVALNAQHLKKRLNA